MKKLFSLLLTLLLLIGLVGCGSSTDSTPDNVGKIDLDNLLTLSDVDLAYAETFEARENGENFRNLDWSTITVDIVVEKAMMAVTLANTSTEDSINTKIDVIGKIVTLDDLSNNTSQDVMEEVALHVINLWESGSFSTDDNGALLKNLYLTRYLDIRLDNHPNLKAIDEMFFDMYQVAKDALREDTESMAINTAQVEDKIDFSKEQLTTD